MENTLVIYTSDQGSSWVSMMAINVSCMKNRLSLIPYENSKFQFIFTNSDLVANLDFAPTILDYVGIEIPYDMELH